MSKVLVVTMDLKKSINMTNSFMFLTLLSLGILFFFFAENNGTAHLYIKKGAYKEQHWKGKQNKKK